MPLYIARTTGSKKEVEQLYSIHEIDYMITKYLEILELAQVFQIGGRLHDKVKGEFEWGAQLTVEGFKFLLKEYEENNVKSK